MVLLAISTAWSSSVYGITDSTGTKISSCAKCCMVRCICLSRPGAMQVLAGVEQVHDLGGFGELAAGDVPGRAVAEDRELADMTGAAEDAFGFHQGREHGRELEGGDVAGGVPV